jgi:hypothetical protein
MGETQDYQLLLRPSGGAQQDRPVEELQSKLLRIPTLEQIDARHYEFGEADAAGIMTLALQAGAKDASDTFERIEIAVPRAWLPARGPQVFAIVFMAAEWLGWEVYDPQIEDTLKKDVVLQGMVAMRRAQLDREGPS